MSWFSYYLLIGLPFGIYGSLKFFKETKLRAGFKPKQLPIIKRVAYYIIAFVAIYSLYPLVIGDMILDAIKLYKIKKNGGFKK